MSRNDGFYHNIYFIFSISILSCLMHSTKSWRGGIKEAFVISKLAMVYLLSKLSTLWCLIKGSTKKFSILINGIVSKA